MSILVPTTQPGNVIVPSRAVQSVQAGAPWNASGRAMTLLPQNLLLSAGALWEDFESAADWTAANGTVADNTTEFRSGANSVKVTTSSGASATIVKTVNWDLSGNWGGLSFWMYVHDAPALYGSNIIKIDLSNNTGVSQVMRHWTFVSNYSGPVGWHRIYIPKSCFSASGGGTFSSAIIRLRFTVYAATSQTPSISFDQLEVGEAHQPAILFRFDDSVVEHYTMAYAYMRQFGIRGTEYNITGNVGSAGYATWAQLQQMSADGWAIGNHTRAHTSLATNSVADQQTAISNGMADLTANGLAANARHLSYPYGAYDANTLVAMTNAGTVTGGTTQQGIDTINNSADGYQPQVLPDYWYGDVFHLRDSSVTSAPTLAALQSVIDKAIASGQIYIPLCHQIGASGQITRANFNAFVDYVVVKCQAGLLNVITVEDLYNLQFGPVAVPQVGA